MRKSTYTSHLHFWQLRLQVSITFYCVRDFLRLRKLCRNWDIPCEEPLQFLQAISDNEISSLRRPFDLNRHGLDIVHRVLLSWNRGDFYFERVPANRGVGGVPGEGDNRIRTSPCIDS